MDLSYLDKYGHLCEGDLYLYDVLLTRMKAIMRNPNKIEELRRAHQEIVDHGHHDSLDDYVLENIDRDPRAEMARHLLRIFEYLGDKRYKPFSKNIVVYDRVKKTPPRWDRVPEEIQFLVPFAKKHKRYLRLINDATLLGLVSEQELKEMDDMIDQYHAVHHSTPQAKHNIIRFTDEEPWCKTTESRYVGNLIRLLGIKYMKDHGQWEDGEGE